MIEDALTLAHDVADGCTLAVRVRPNAKKTMSPVFMLAP